MTKYKNSIFIILSLLFMAACHTNKKVKPSFYGADDGEEEVTNVSSSQSSGYLQDDDLETRVTTYGEVEEDVITVHFEERGGVKYVPVKVNGMGIDMIFDTGCSGTLISIAEARYLYEKGCLGDDDFLGMTQSQIADGSIVEDMVIRLRELVIDDAIVCTDVIATVSENSRAPLLLGNEVLNRAASYSINNENQTIQFTIE